jgi:hypothetical protein
MTTREDEPMTLEKGQTVYLYLREVDDDTGDPEDYLGRFPAGTEATVNWVTEGSFRGLDVEVEVYDDDGGSETFSVRHDEISVSLLYRSLHEQLQDSILELRSAEYEYGGLPF